MLGAGALVCVAAVDGYSSNSSNDRRLLLHVGMEDTPLISSGLHPATIRGRNGVIDAANSGVTLLHIGCCIFRSVARLSAVERQENKRSSRFAPSCLRRW